MLIIENFIPPEDKQKVQTRAVYDEDEDTWTLSPFTKDKYVLEITECSYYMKMVVCKPGWLSFCYICVLIKRGIVVTRNYRLYRKENLTNIFLLLFEMAKTFQKLSTSI